MGALAAAIAAFFYHRGDKVTGFFAGFTTFIGMFSVSELGVIAGIFLGFASFVLTWIYKQKYLEAIRRNGSTTLLEDGVE